MIVGRPLARYLDNGWTAEVTRLCVQEGGHQSVCGKAESPSFGEGKTMSGQNGEIRIMVGDVEGKLSANVEYKNVSPDMAWEALRAMIDCVEEVVKKIVPPTDERQCVLAALGACRLVMSGGESWLLNVKMKKVAKT